MTRLIMDSSTNYLYIALIKDDIEVWKYLQKGNNDHSEKLSVLLKLMLEETKMNVANIDEIVVGKGPGSYTGVRVSMTIAKVFAWAKQIRLFTYSALDLIASSKLKKDGIFLIKLDARRGNSFFKVLQFHHGTATTLIEDSFMNNEEITQMMNEHYPNAIVIEQIDESSFDFKTLETLNLIYEVKDIYGLVPNYVRNGL
jgi:tRNA threonylcarbamoyladenosine biosynthesis protein TsaB